MKLPAAIEKTAATFDRMSLRERGLVAGAALAATVMTWVVAVQDPVNARRRELNDEISGLQVALESAADAAQSDPANLALAKQRKLKTELDAINAKLEATSAGLIPPERMVRVIRDVLAQQRGIALVSLHNKPVASLVEVVPVEGEVTQPESTGPYMHPVELIVEGRYLDVLAYLRALEASPWHFYWKVLDLHSTQYPINRVRIELSTLSMDKEWLGV